MCYFQLNIQLLCSCCFTHDSPALHALRIHFCSHQPRSTEDVNDFGFLLIFVFLAIIYILDVGVYSKS
jgi:hypothetical protein